MNEQLNSLTRSQAFARRSPERGPPKPHFVLCVGVTGHRAEALGNDDVERIAERIRQTLELVAAAGAVLLERHRDCFAPGPPRLRFVSPLADGADQIAADVALELGWQVEVIVPFALDAYRLSFTSAGTLQRFDALLDRAECLLELPGDPADSLEAYVMTGRGTVAHCDILIAVWDGLPPRGRGGTGEVVQLALTRGTAIVHIPVGVATDARLLWAAFDPSVLTIGEDRQVERPLDRANIEALLAALLLPPGDEKEHKFLQRFARERLRNMRPRIEYPLLLAATGVKPFRPRSHTDRYCAAEIRDEWRRYRTRCAEAHNILAPMDLLEEAYSWADRLATHFALTYRSGHIFNFVLGAVAVCLGLAAFIAPHLKLEEAALEMLITIAIIANAAVGSRREWHRRWLDYRQLAERLRPMRSLKLLGIAAPDPPGTETNPVPRRWVDWYASAIWRGLCCPSGTVDNGCASRLAISIADHEVAPQVAYHERHSEQIHRLDRRLERIGTLLFGATLLVSLATLIGLGIGAAFVNDYGSWFTLVSAGFPALGTAVFGIRFQADFGGDAVRSQATAETLRGIDLQLRGNVPLSRAADLSEQAARVMLADLDEWRLVNQQRDLSVG